MNWRPAVGLVFFGGWSFGLSLPSSDTFGDWLLFDPLLYFDSLILLACLRGVLFCWLDFVSSLSSGSLDSSACCCSPSCFWFWMLGRLSGAWLLLTWLLSAFFCAFES